MTEQKRPSIDQLPPSILPETLLATRQFESVLRTDSFELLTGRSNPELAREVARILQYDLDEPVTVFADGESRIKLDHNIRKKDVFVIQSTGRRNERISANDSVVDLLFMIHAAGRSSGDEITAVVPYFAYGRQDRKDQPRVTISGADIAEHIEFAGAHRLLTVDLHAEQMQGNLRRWDNLYATAVLLPEIQKLDTSNMIVVSPDVGGVKRAEKMSFLLNGGTGEIAIVHKRRDTANQSVALAVIGDVDGKDALIVDDMADTLGTMANAARLLKKEGAKSVRAAVTHGLFTDNSKDEDVLAALRVNALDNLTNSPIDEIFVTDTLWLRPEVRNHPKVKVVSVAPLLAEAIKRIYSGDSLSALIPSPKK